VEVRGGYRLTSVTPDCNQVRAFHGAAGVRVSDEKAEVDVIRATTTVNARDVDGHDLFVTTEGGCARGSRAANDLGSTQGNWRVKGKDNHEVARAPANFGCIRPFRPWAWTEEL
jgi:hypothetical protein